MSAMLDYSLSREQLDELRAAHRRTRDKREADRIKAVVALATGWTAEEVAELLQIDPNTVRHHFKRYRTEGLAGLNRVGEGVGGSPSLLTEEQLIELDVHLQTNLYLSAKAVAHWVEETYGVSYTESGMTAVLHRLGYVYKKPRYVPGKADREAQEQFLAEYEKLQETKGKSECRRARDAKRDIPVPLSPCARATTCTCRGRPAPGPRLRHFAPPPDPYDEWLDGVSDALASGLRQLRDLRPLRHFGQPLAPTPTADYPPRASRFPGGQRRLRVAQTGQGSNR